MKSPFKGQGIVVIGGQWGDEGKGRVVDALSEHCDLVVRFQGGNNAGHSLHVQDISLVLHLIPCGIMRPGKVAVIGNGVVIDPRVLFHEIELLRKHNIHCSPENLKISRNAHIIFPFHKSIDSKREQGANHIGTTKRGIGPCYEDKVARFGLRASDLLWETSLRKKIEAILHNRYEEENITSDLEALVQEAKAFGDILRPYLIDTGDYVYNLLKQGKRVLFEGAQGTLLDIDHGTYPYVTSSNCISAQAAIGIGIGPEWLSDVFIVSKAYCTRVGEGPFITEGTLAEQADFRRLGHEFGATTGRPRRCGHLDLVALRYSARLNGAHGLILTKIDILSMLGAPKVATSYTCQGREINNFLEGIDLLLSGQPVNPHYLSLNALGAMPQNPRSLEDFSKETKAFCSLVEDYLEIPIKLISYGPKRGDDVLINT